MENELIPPETPPQENPPAPWSANDTWLGLFILVAVVALTLGLQIFLSTESVSQFILVIFEFLLLVPIAVIFLWRNVKWTELGIRRFQWRDVALGCGLLIAIYVIVIINNLIMLALGVITQAEAIFEVLGNLESPVLFVIVGVILAPVLEELFFRGFVFKGLREKYGWKAALVISSAIFSVFHLQVATLLPMFLLGGLFAYLYQRTESVFPGMIMHFLVNAFGMVGLLVAYQMGV
jgi:membrane protease YdiL (CAAX protease family)